MQAVSEQSCTDSNHTYKQMFGDRLDPEGRLVRDNFAKWFDGSALITEHGPMPLYHANRVGSEITSFKRRPDEIAFFAEDDFFAWDWLGDSVYEGGCMHKVYANPKRIWDFNNEADVRALTSLLVARGETIDDHFASEIRCGNWLYLEHFDIPEILRTHGYDAMWITEEAIGHVGAMFRNLALIGDVSIKSAVGNTGRFDPACDDILDGPANLDAAELNEPSTRSCRNVFSPF